MAGDGREGGFIKLHRKVDSSALWRSLTAEQRAVMVEVLFLANWKPARARWKDQWYEVGRGELSHTLATIAAEARVSVKVVRSTLVALMADDTEAGGNGPFLVEKYPIPGTGPGTGPRVLSIVNYAKYQDVPEDMGTGPGTAGARVGHGSGTGGAQREEGEEGKKGKNLPFGKRRTSLVGVGSPAFEALEHWNKTVWPSLAGCAPSSPSPYQVKALGDLCSTHGVAEVKARMDRAAADSYWRGRLTLDDIVDRFDRFAARSEGAKQTVTAPASDHSKFGKGEVAL